MSMFLSMTAYIRDSACEIQRFTKKKKKLLLWRVVIKVQKTNDFVVINER